MSARQRRAAAALERLRTEAFGVRAALDYGLSGPRPRADDTAAVVTALGTLLAELGEVAALARRTVDEVTRDEQIRGAVAAAADDLARHGEDLRRVGPQIASLMAVLADEDGL